VVVETFVEVVPTAHELNKGKLDERDTPKVNADVANDAGVLDWDEGTDVETDADNDDAGETLGKVTCSSFNCN
jgi:hypothetical protein